MKLSKRVRKSLRTVVVAIVLGVLCTALIEVIVYVSSRMIRPPLQGMENQIIDQAFQVRKENTKNKILTYEDVVIIDIDDRSIEEMGRSQNWPREYDARVINYIASGKPAAIGIDYLYTESESLPAAYEVMLAERGIANTSELAKAYSSDNELSEAIRNAGNVYLGFFDDDANPDSLFDATLEEKMRFITSNDGKHLDFLSISHPVLPIEEFNQFSKATGSISVPSMYDGSVRRYPVLQRLTGDSTNSKYIANFPFYMMLDAKGLTEKDVRIEDDNILIGDTTKIPLLEDGTFRINWLGSEQKIRYISYYKVWDELVPAEFFENKYVFFGTSASGLQDLKTVPSQESKMPGVEVHVVAFLNMMNGSFLNEITEMEAIPWFVLTSIILVFFFLIVRPFLGFFFAFGLYFSERFIFELWVIPKHGLVFPIISLMTLTLLTYLISILYIYFIRERKSRRLKNAFGTYVSPEIVEQIAKDPGNLQLGGEKKVLTVLFSDLRGFTSYSEKLDPQQLVAVLNNYLSAMSNIIFQHKGTIDKFIGDAIMAIFGAPIVQKDHADRACRVALDMITELENVNAHNATNGFPPLFIGVGVNTGEMTVGNIGSERRFDYTVIGDAVNLGSRLEGLTKFFQVLIIVSDHTRLACTTNDFIFRNLGAVKVKGKEKPIFVFELKYRQTADATYLNWLAIWDKAFEEIDKRNLSKAIEHLEECKAIYPDDVATEYYIQQCNEYLTQPENFELIIKMETK